MSVLFLPECFTETLLYSHLLYEQKDHYTHKHSITRVLGEMSFDKGSYQTIIGCIDKDKKIEYKKFNEYEEFSSQYQVSILRYKSNHTKILIQLDPAAEAWLLETAKVAGINPEDFGLPKTPKELKVFSTFSVPQNQAKLKNFIKSIFSTNHERSAYLREVVESYVPKPPWVW